MTTTDQDKRDLLQPLIFSYVKNGVPPLTGCCITLGLFLHTVDRQDPNEKSTGWWWWCWEAKKSRIQSGTGTNAKCKKCEQDEDAIMQEIVVLLMTKTNGREKRGESGISQLQERCRRCGREASLNISLNISLQYLMAYEHCSYCISCVRRTRLILTSTSTSLWMLRKVYSCLYCPDPCGQPTQQNATNCSARIVIGVFCD